MLASKSTLTKCVQMEKTCEFADFPAHLGRSSKIARVRAGVGSGQGEIGVRVGSRSGRVGVRLDRGQAGSGLDQGRGPLYGSVCAGVCDDPHAHPSVTAVVL